MQIAVISDLHLGIKDKLDQFNRNPGAETQLHSLLAYLEGHVDKIILLGDVFETLRGKSLNKKKTLSSIIKAYPRIAEKITGNNKYLLVQGNHDKITGSVFGAMDLIKIKDGNSQIAFFHGHQLDPEVGTFWVKNFEATGCWLGGWLERFGIDITKSGNLRSKTKALESQWGVGAFEHAACKMGERLNCDVVVTGHSHHPMKVEIGNTLFLNSGARVAGRQDMVIIDTTAHQYDVYKKFNAESQHLGLDSEELEAVN